ncbi:hypothetical protein NS506_02649 [Nocardia seriolae]|uniref:Uncharacterized protein n=2 Tax=Nocardia seriolae TaxID=37332 RepID=A0ABC8ARG4_9NOCA|nr:hypothetical protein NS506_02649 [Nocardia seriolae]
MLLLHGEQCQKNGCPRRAFFVTLGEYRTAWRYAQGDRD